MEKKKIVSGLPGGPKWVNACPLDPELLRDEWNMGTAQFFSGHLSQIALPPPMSEYANLTLYGRSEVPETMNSVEMVNVGKT